MLPLAPPSPRSTPEFAEALGAGLAAHGVVARVQAEGVWPELSAVEIALEKVERPRRVQADEASAEAVRVAVMRVVGRPVRIEDAAVEVEASLKGVRAEVVGAQLRLVGAESGALRLAAAKVELELGLRRVLTRLAEGQGATLKELALELRAPDERTLEFAVRVTAKMFIASATVTVRGRVTVNEALALRVEELAGVGEGMAATLALGFLEPQLAAWRGRVIELGEYAVGGLRARSVRLRVGAVVAVEAEFGG